MAVASGLGGSVGIAPEVTPGTYVAPTLFPEVNKSDLKKRKGIAQGGGLAAGRLVQAGSRRVLVFEDGGGSQDLEVTNKKMGLFLSHLFGAHTGPTQQAATAAYLQTHTLADNVGKSLSIQNGIPDASGTVRPYTFLGCKITDAEFSCAQGSNNGLLMASFGIDAKQASEAQVLAAPSAVTGMRPFHFGQMGVKLGTYGAEAAVGGVKGLSVKIERPQDTERYYANNAGLKAEPLVNDFVKVSGSITADFLDKATFADRFAADGSIALLVEFVGPLIATTYYETFRLKLPMIFFDGDSPILDGPGIVSGTFPFTAQFDLTNAAVICEYISTDTALV